MLKLPCVSRGCRPVGGFTLVELLVVVGIIGILAAIAAPNYQSAVVRSKVARFHADGRAVEYAVESYNAEFGSYPAPDLYPVNSDCDNWENHPSDPYRGYLTRRLTTPTTYLSKLPVDVFQNQTDEGSCFPERKRPPLFSNDRFNRDVWGTGSLRGNYTSWSWEALKLINVSFEQGDNPAVWMVFSPGPDLDRDTDMTEPVHYDPTNGTVSSGDIYRYGPGLGIPEDR